MTARSFLTETGASVTVPSGTAARIGAGGQGQVFRCEHHGEVLAIKLCRQLEEQRLIALQRLGSRCGPVATWPSQRLFHSRQGQRGDLAGYAMRCIDSGRSVSAARLFNFEEIEALRRFTWRDAVLAGLRLAESMAQLHRHGVVIGDLNPENVLFEQQQVGPGEASDWRAVLLDSDSFQIASEEGRFVCPVSRPPYTAPELIGTDFSSIWREPSSDAFALAVILYQLLLHDHPYDNALLAEEPELAVTARIRRGLYPHAALPTPGLQPGPYRPAPAEISAAIDAAFRRSFSALPALRPTAAEWALLLRTLHRQVVPCARNRRHMHPKGQACLWCATEASLGQPICRFSTAAPITQPARPTAAAPEAATATKAKAGSQAELVQLLQDTLQQARDLVERRAALIEQLLQLEPVLARLREQNTPQERTQRDQQVLARLQGVRQRLSRWLGHQHKVQQRQQLAEQLLAQSAETTALSEQQGRSLEQQRRNLLQALAHCGSEALAERLPLHDPRRQAQRMAEQAAEHSRGQWLRQQLAQQRLRDWRIEGFGEGRWQLLERHGLERGDQLYARIDQLTTLAGIGPGLQQRLRRHLQGEVALLEARGTEVPPPQLDRRDLPRLLGEDTLEQLSQQQRQLSRLDGDVATLAQAIEALNQHLSERTATRQALQAQFESLF